MKCPQCKGDLQRVSYPNNCMLNYDQWEATIAGNWCCETCPDNGRAKSGKCYWWDEELVVEQEGHIIPDFEREEKVVQEAIIAARKIQTFLWGDANGEWGLEEWKRMFRKRVAKIDAIDESNPHAAVELRKRLLQTAALAVALITVVEKVGIPERSSDAPPSNLPQFADK